MHSLLASALGAGAGARNSSGGRGPVSGGRGGGRGGLGGEGIAIANGVRGGLVSSAGGNTGDSDCVLAVAGSGRRPTDSVDANSRGCAVVVVEAAGEGDGVTGSHGGNGTGSHAGLCGVVLSLDMLWGDERQTRLEVLHLAVNDTCDLYINIR